MPAAPASLSSNHQREESMPLDSVYDHPSSAGVPKLSFSLAPTIGPVDRHPSPSDPHLEQLERDEKSFRSDDDDQLDARPQPPHRPLLPILGLSATAIVPAALGLGFYLSLGLHASDGAHYPDGTFVRPDSHSLQLGNNGTWASVRFSPLLVAAVASTLVEMMAPWVMMLFAYHLAYHWLIASSPNTLNLDALPSPFQYFLTMEFINNSSPFSALRFITYLFKPSPSRRRRFTIIPRSHRARLSPILILSSLVLIIVLGFIWAIKVVNVILHDRITSVVQNITYHQEGFKANAVVTKGCEDPVFNTCGVLNRTLKASEGGANASQEFRVYESADRSRGSMSFIGPADTDPAIPFAVAHTFATATVCEAFHPSCFVKDMIIQACGPAQPPPHGKGDWNAIVYDQGFDTIVWKQRLQTFITAHGNISGDNGAPLRNGANINPFTTATFGCFQNYADIAYDDRNMSFHTPFINWWKTGQGIGNKPAIMCSILVCNTTVYDATYQLARGSLSLQNDTLKIANSSATLAISGAAAYLGTPNTSWYQYAPRFLDDQLQVDLTQAGNKYGNDTQQFAAAWAQSLSNRLEGWSVGAIELQPIGVDSTRPEVAISIPLKLAYAFFGLHLLFALVILLLGLSALLLPGVVRQRPRSDPRGEYKGRNWANENLALAQRRLTDPTTLIHELMITKRSYDGFPNPMVSSSCESVPRRLNRRAGSSQISGETKTNKPQPEFAEGEEVRVALVSDRSGGLELSFPG